MKPMKDKTRQKYQRIVFHEANEGQNKSEIPENSPSSNRGYDRA